MKVFFKLLLAGLFFMALGFVTEHQITSIDDDVGTYISQDIQDCNATFENFEIETRLTYQEVGIVPELKHICISSTSTDRKEMSQGDLLRNLNPQRDLAKYCNQMFYDEYRYDKANYLYNKNEDFRSGRPRCLINDEHVV